MKNIITINSNKDERVFIHVVPGHFVTSNAHMNYYVGTSDIKHNHAVSVDTAKLMAQFYKNEDIDVDTVLCLYETQALGAYLAHEIATPSMMTPSPKGTVYTIGPEYDATGNMIFRDNLSRMIKNKNVVILISCITTGKTIERAIESVSYYGGNVVGISAVFSATDEISNVKVNSVFTKEDIPGYEIYDKNECPLCTNGTNVDATVNSHGYSEL